MFPQAFPSWFAIQVAPRAEKRVAEYLAYKGHQSFLPLCRSLRRWSDRRKLLEMPLIPGYVFCRMGEAATGMVLTTPGIVRIVGFGGKPAPVAEEEIRTLEQVVRSGVDASPAQFVKVGQKVEVKNGPLSGIAGIIIQIKNHRRLIISVETLMKSIALDVDAYEVAAL